MQLARSATANGGEGGGGYNQPRVHIAEVLGFITEAEGQIDGILS